METLLSIITLTSDTNNINFAIPNDIGGLNGIDIKFYGDISSFSISGNSQRVTDLGFGDSITTIKSNSFNDLENLSNINIYSSSPLSLETNAFNNCNNVLNITINNTQSEINNFMYDESGLDIDKTTSYHFAIQDFLKPEHFYHAFRNLNTLKGISINDLPPFLDKRKFIDIIDEVNLVLKFFKELYYECRIDPENKLYEKLYDLTTGEEKIFDGIRYCIVNPNKQLRDKFIITLPSPTTRIKSPYYQVTNKDHKSFDETYHEKIHKIFYPCINREIFTNAIITMLKNMEIYGGDKFIPLDVDDSSSITSKDIVKRFNTLESFIQSFIIKDNLNTLYGRGTITDPSQAISKLEFRSVLKDINSLDYIRYNEKSFDERKIAKDICVLMNKIFQIFINFSLLKRYNYFIKRSEIKKFTDLILKDDFSLKPSISIEDMVEKMNLIIDLMNDFKNHKYENHELLKGDKFVSYTAIENFWNNIDITKDNYFSRNIDEIRSKNASPIEVSYKILERGFIPAIRKLVYDCDTSTVNIPLSWETIESRFMRLPNVTRINKDGLMDGNELIKKLLTLIINF